MDYLERTKNGTSFSGSDMDIYDALVIAMQLKLYAVTGMKAHKGWTPTRALLWASNELGIKFKRGQYFLAAEMLEKHANNLKHLQYTD